MSAMLVIGVVGLCIDVALRAVERWLSRRWGRV
jgi:ABC-type nitrate/sulfonate/bicarbonate transport system permease component